MPFAGVNRALRPILVLGVVVSVAQAFGCGGEDQSASAGTPAAERNCRNASASQSEYVTVLCEFRDAALAHKTFDAYGYAEYMPAPLRAAIDAFCLVVDEPPEDLEAEALADPAYFADKLIVTAKTEVDSGRAELGSMASLHRAVAKLRAILGVESFSNDLSEHYARACY